MIVVWSIGAVLAAIVLLREHYFPRQSIRKMSVPPLVNAPSAKPPSKRKHRVVVVTGARGFFGSHLIERLAADGEYDEIRAAGAHPLMPNSPLANLPPFVKHLVADVQDAQAMLKLVEGAETVFHTAAVVAMRYTDATLVSALALTLSLSSHS